jgi:hypothetical protein
MTSYGVPTRTQYVWLLYRFWDKYGRLLYIGQTRQDAIARWTQHLREQPWGHLIRRMEADPVEYATEAEARAAEKAAIHAELPYCNKEHNLGNPNRWVFDAHPVAVQRRGGRPVRVPLAPERPTFWTPRRIGYALVASVWLAMFGGVWWAIGPQVPAGQGAGMSAVVMVAVSVAAYRARPRRRRRRRW